MAKAEMGWDHARLPECTVNTSICAATSSQTKEQTSAKENTQYIWKQSILQTFFDF